MSLAAGHSPLERELYTELECDVFHELEDYVSESAFLKAFEQPAKQRAGILRCFSRSKAPVTPVQPSSQLTESTSFGGQPSLSRQQDALADSVPEASTSSSSSEARTSEDGFVMLDKRDAAEAFAFYIASVIMELPEAQAVPPKELQKALIQTLKALKKSRFQQVCSVGHKVYRWSALAYSTFQVYQSPWLARAVLYALWTLSRMSVRMIL